MTEPGITGSGGLIQYIPNQISQTWFSEISYKALYMFDITKILHILLRHNSVSNCRTMTGWYTVVGLSLFDGSFGRENLFLYQNLSLFITEINVYSIKLYILVLYLLLSTAAVTDDRWHCQQHSWWWGQGGEGAVVRIMRLWSGCGAMVRVLLVELVINSFKWSAQTRFRTWPLPFLDFWYFLIATAKSNTTVISPSKCTSHFVWFKLYSCNNNNFCNISRINIEIV